MRLMPPMFAAAPQPSQGHSPATFRTLTPAADSVQFRGKIDHETSDTPLLSPRYAEAMSYAMTLHNTQTRKGSTIPYVAHLQAVAALVLEMGGTEDEAIAAWLHDGPEDQGGRETLAEIRRRFGDAVADIVEGCSDAFTQPKPPYQQRKQAYIDHLATDASKSIMLVSSCDKLHNARSLLSDYRDVGEELWKRFTGTRAQTLWYYNSLVEAYAKRGYDTPVTRELGRTVATLEKRIAENEANAS